MLAETKSEVLRIIVTPLVLGSLIDAPERRVLVCEDMGVMSECCSFELSPSSKCSTKDDNRNRLKFPMCRHFSVAGCFFIIARCVFAFDSSCYFGGVVTYRGLRLISPFLHLVQFRHVSLVPVVVGEES